MEETWEELPVDAFGASVGAGVAVGFGVAVGVGVAALFSEVELPFPEAESEDVLEAFPAVTSDEDDDAPAAELPFDAVEAAGASGSTLLTLDSTVPFFASPSTFPGSSAGVSAACSADDSDSDVSVAYVTDADASVDTASDDAWASEADELSATGSVAVPSDVSLEVATSTSATAAASPLFN